MADKETDEGGVTLPPKLDLRKSGLIKSQESTCSENSDSKKKEEISARPASPDAPATKAPSSKPPAPVPSDPTSSGPKSTTAPIGIPKPGAGTKPVFRPSSAGVKLKRPGSSKSPAGLKSVKPKIVTEESPSEAKQASSAKVEASKIKLPGANPEAPETVGLKAVASVASQKDATKIPLEAAKAKPVGTTDSMEPPSSLLRSSPDEKSQIPASTKTKIASIEGNRKPSRIPLEAALGEGVGRDDAPEATPKTIRIKRPGGSGPAVKTATAKPVAARQPGTTAGAAQADPVDEGGAAKGLTRKKTVVVKRSPAGGAKNLTVSRAQSEAMPAASVVKPTLVQANEPGALTGIMAFVAVLIASALIYMLTAQVIGPDKSQISYATGAPSLPFPGKIQQH